MRLISLLSEINNGNYVRSSDRRCQLVPSASCYHLTLRELFALFLSEKRSLRGVKTAQNYRARLGPVLTFAESSKHRQRWPYVTDIDRDFVVELRAFLFAYLTTPNGKSGAKKKNLSPRQVHNILDCFRTALNWGSMPVIGKLPPGWVNPLTSDIVGQPTQKNPLRYPKLNQSTLIDLVKSMDRWELTHFGLLFLLPPRPDEFTGLMVSSVDLINHRFSIGSQFHGNDFTKTRLSYDLPFPPDVLPLIQQLIGERVAGPLFRKKGESLKQAALKNKADFQIAFDRYTAKGESHSITTEQDRKQALRKFLCTQGAVSPDYLRKQFLKLLERTNLKGKASLYDLRHAVTQGMKDSGMPHLDLRYLTSHATNDILNEYSAIDIHGSMNQYFKKVEPLIQAIVLRMREIGIGSC